MTRHDDSKRSLILAIAWLGLALGIVVVQPECGKRSVFGQVTEAQIRASIDRGTAYLKSESSKWSRAHAALAAYALIKSGVPKESPTIQTLMKSVVASVKDGEYQPSSHHYGAGCEMLALEAAGREQYQPQMQAIVRYILSRQESHGGWFYPNRDGRNKGDTSITQYALLGLWMGRRAEIKVPMEAWDRAAAWLLSTQMPQGSFYYHPGEKNYPGHGVTAAGTGCLGICRLHLYPNYKQASRKSEKKKQSGKRFGVLTKVDLDTVEEEEQAKTAITSAADYKPRTSLAAINAGARRGVAWMANNFAVSVERFPLYYLYALERMTALEDVQMLGPHDWYAKGAAQLIRIQQKDGGWRAQSGGVAATCFAILFLTKSTAQTLGRQVRSPEFGAGLLAGGRGLPDNLSQIEMKDGKVQASKLSGAFEELLAELEKPKSLQVESVQAAIVEKVQIGDPEKLIGQKERLIKLVKDRRAEVRRTALWALGRTGDLRIAPIAIEALNDNDVDVMVEAQNALCWLSRKPRGFGLPQSPLTGMAEDATDVQKQAAIKKWREQATTKWRAWYLSVRSYDERDDLAEQEKR